MAHTPSTAPSDHAPTGGTPPWTRRAAVGQLSRLAGLVAAGGLTALSGCASLLQREPVRVDLVGLEPLAGEGLELRMALKLRVTNPNDNAIAFDGLSVTLDLQGSRFASGVSNERGTVPRFGDAVITVPVSISALALLRQAMGVAGGPPERVSYTLHGRLAGTAFGGVGFSTSGDMPLPKGLAALGR